MRFRRLVPPPTPYPSNHAHACAPHPLGSRPTSLTRYPCSHLTRGLALTPRSTTHGRVPLTRPAFLRLTPHAFTRDTHHAFTRSLPHAAHAYVTVKSPRVCDPHPSRSRPPTTARAPHAPHAHLYAFAHTTVAHAVRVFVHVWTRSHTRWLEFTPDSRCTLSHGRHNAQPVRFWLTCSWLMALRPTRS